MAELYLARTVGLEGFEKLCVLKRILPQFADNASFVNMFLAEARLAATLHHPNIAQVYDIGQDGTDYFFSMEYVHGQDLGNLVASATDSGVPISLDAALTLVAGLCAGLHYAHEKAGPDGKPLNVVHRDVSPSNVLVSYDGAVKLVDFGIARAGSNPATTRGGLKGKIAYMSPEQCRGKVALDRRSDVFSIGTILYELTTSRLPFTDETEYGILNQIVNRDAEPPSKHVPGFSPALEAIILRALARDPNQRFATALELQKAVEDYAHDNRLRVSPLVLARLMGTLFPARLEEWDHARAQGAFFVEQHVVRTLLENGLSSDAPAPGDDSTTVSPPPPAPVSVDEPTQVRGSAPRIDDPSRRSLPGAPPRRASQPAVRAEQLTPTTPGLILPQHLPPRGLQHGLPLSPQGASEPPALEPAPLPLPPRMAPVPSYGRMPTPVPGMPGAVPIVMPPAAPPAQDAAAITHPSTHPVVQPIAHALAASVAQPVSPAVDVTERVRAREAMRGETAIVQIGRSRTPAILLGVVGLVAAALAAVIVLRGTGKSGSRAPTEPAQTEPAQTEPAGAAKQVAPPDPEGAAKQAAPPTPAESQPAQAAQPEPPPAQPAQAAQPEPTPAPPEPAADIAEKAPPPDEPAPSKPSKPTKKSAKIVQKPAKLRPAKLAQPPKKDPPKKAEEAKETKWTPDSPFMPVRTPDKK